MTLDAKYELAEDSQGRRYWRCWLDGKEVESLPHGFAVTFWPERKEVAEGVFSEYALGTIVHIKGDARSQQLMRRNLRDIKDRLIEELLKNDPELTPQSAEALMYETLRSMGSTEFSEAIVKGAEDGA